MTKTLTATELRANLYRVLDEVIETGRPCRVARGKRAAVIRPEARKGRKGIDFSRLKRRRILTAPFDEIVHTSWQDPRKAAL